MRSVYMFPLRFLQQDDKSVIYACLGFLYGLVLDKNRLLKKIKIKI